MDEDWSDVWFEVDYIGNCYKINVDVFSREKCM